MKITYKIGKKRDLVKFLDFFRKTLSQNFPNYSKNSVLYTIDFDYGPKWLKKKLVKKVKKVYLALDHERIVGYLLVTKSIAGVSYGDWLAVDKEFRKQGIASKLLTLWEKKALEEGAHALQLWTSSKNNVDFYRKRDFSMGGLFPKAWHGHDTYLMYKSLRVPKEENYLKEFLKIKEKDK